MLIAFYGQIANRFNIASRYALNLTEEKMDRSELIEATIQPNRSYENPNYRKLYAKLSIDNMIGSKQTEDNGVNEDTKLLSNEDETSLSQQMSNNDNECDDMQLFYDEYEEEDDEEDEYYEDELELMEEEEKVGSKQTSNITSTTELPDGWERHEDELGPYFWHIPTGTIQREKPFLDTIDKSMIRSDSLVFLDKSAINVDYNPSDLIEEEDERLTNKDDANLSDDVERKALISKKKVIANLRLTFPTDDETDEDDGDREQLSFEVHSLGWLDVDESQINPQTGSMVIKRCIQQLSSGPMVRGRENAASCWGPEDTQLLLLRFSSDKMCLIDPTTETVLSIQLIREIRMWAVDEQNFFAYVVKDRQTAPTNGSKTTALKCHVFHCDPSTPSKQSVASRIAIHLKEALIRIKNRTNTNASNRNKGRMLSRPSKLMVDFNSDCQSALNGYEFPTPIEEPRKSIQAMYMGLVPVKKPMGVDVLNMAIEEIVSSLKLSLSDENDETELMQKVNVHISPSNIVVECDDTGATLIECRVRYLSFLGISLDNVKRCGFIMQVDERQFVAHCFHVEPSAGALCKTIEAACKLRYQKCLDAHYKIAKDRQTPMDSRVEQPALINSPVALRES